MKKSHYLYIALILAMVVALPSLSRAEEGNTNATVNADASIRTNTNAGLPPVPKPGTRPPLTNLEKLRATNELKAQNIKKNEEERNRMLRNASGTPAERMAVGQEKRTDIKEVRMEGRIDIKNASSSGERKEIRHDMRKDEFQIRKEALVKQLNITLSNLKQIRVRISTRIDKATAEGKDMTEASRLLGLADTKIALAEVAINSLANFNITATSTVATTANIDLTKPRQVNEAAVKSLRDARQALVDVVLSISASLKI